MTRQEAEAVTSEYIKPIFGFALKRCKNQSDAEDLSQEIVLKIFNTLCKRDDIENADKFIWTLAHNMLSNYYRDSSRQVIGISVDEIERQPSESDSYFFDRDDDVIQKMQSEIAYLSKIQRRIIIAYYFENRKQSDIAHMLDIPLGTVKWHLFEAKKELKRGMNTMREASDLKFNPIKFHSWGINGTVGTKDPDEFFRSPLSQNICYCVRNTEKTVNEIADDLGVSPVYVESEVEFLEKYGFLLESRGKYIVNFIISEPTAEFLTMQNEMYMKAARLFANELYDELISSGILDDPDIICHQTDEPVSLTESQRADRNFILWSLIPYIAARSGERLTDGGISFDEAATIRPDGGHNIFHAAVVPDEMTLPDDYVYMKNWCGPMWNDTEKHILWQIDSQWSDHGNNLDFRYSENARRILSLYEREAEDRLSKYEYAWLAERGYVKTCGDYDGDFKASWQIVILENADIRDKLLAVGDHIREKHLAEFNALKAPYVKAVLESVPAHLRKVREYELQFTFHSDGWFLLHCITELLKSGKLKEPTENQRRSLTTVITPA